MLWAIVQILGDLHARAHRRHLGVKAILFHIPPWFSAASTSTQLAASQLDGVLNYVEAEEVALVGEDDGR